MRIMWRKEKGTSYLQLRSARTLLEIALTSKDMTEIYGEKLMKNTTMHVNISQKKKVKIMFRKKSMTRRLAQPPYQAYRTILITKQ